MKSIKYILTIFFGVLVLVSCEEYLKDAAVPLDRPGGDDFYDTPEKVKAGVIGLMNQLYTVYERSDGAHNVPIVFLNRSDDGMRDANEDAYGDWNLTRSNSPTGLWNNNFEMVSRCNILISSITKGFPDYDDDPVLARYMGDARALRGYAYMNLVFSFGDLPKLTEQLSDFEEAVTVTRSPASEIWSEIILPDLEYARTHCYTRSQIEELSELGMFTKAAARLYLAQAYLFNGRYAEAEAEAEAVIASGEYTWIDNFEDVFHGMDATVNNDNHSASILEIQHKYPDRPNYYVRWLPFALQQAAQMNLPTTATRPTDSLLFTMLESGEDVRYWVTGDTGMFDAVDSVYIRCNYWRKTHDANVKGTDMTGEFNLILLRLADAYHLAAEAEVQQGKYSEAVAHLNKTRERAGVPIYDVSQFTDASTAMDLYLHERRMEFAGEFKRLPDLLRTGKCLERMSVHTGRQLESFRLVMPIPESEIALNPGGMIQNPGY